MELKRLEKDIIIENCFHADLNDSQKHLVLDFFNEHGLIEFDTSSILNRINNYGASLDVCSLAVALRTIADAIEFMKHALILR